MKKIVSILFIGLAFGSVVKGQVAIEKSFSGNPSVLLEFHDMRVAAKTDNRQTVGVNGDNKTLILPIVESINSNSKDGTIWFDANDNKIKLRKVSGDIDMTLAGIDVTSPSIAEKEKSGVVIGADTSSTPGVLVLESQDKAMVLPHVDSVLSVINPEPGAMVYDKAEKAIAVFNGDRWFFWGKY